MIDASTSEDDFDQARFVAAFLDHFEDIERHQTRHFGSRELTRELDYEHARHEAEYVDFARRMKELSPEEIVRIHRIRPLEKLLNLNHDLSEECAHHRQIRKGLQRELFAAIDRVGALERSLAAVDAHREHERFRAPPARPNVSTRDVSPDRMSAAAKALMLRPDHDPVGTAEERRIRDENAQCAA